MTFTAQQRRRQKRSGRRGQCSWKTNEDALEMTRFNLSLSCGADLVTGLISFASCFCASYRLMISDQSAAKARWDLLQLVFTDLRCEYGPHILLYHRTCLMQLQTMTSLRRKRSAAKRVRGARARLQLIRGTKSKVRLKVV